MHLILPLAFVTWNIHKMRKDFPRATRSPFSQTITYYVQGKLSWFMMPSAANIRQQNNWSRLTDDWRVAERIGKYSRKYCKSLSNSIADVICYSMWNAANSAAWNWQPKKKMYEIHKFIPEIVISHDVDGRIMNHKTRCNHKPTRQM